MVRIHISIGLLFSSIVMSGNGYAKGTPSVEGHYCGESPPTLFTLLTEGLNRLVVFCYFFKHLFYF